MAIELNTGPEILTGSTRLKAGTSQKMVLNMLSTAAFTRLGKVYENLKVDVQASNEKLEGRARRIVREAKGLPEDEADVLLGRARGSVNMAVVMGKTGLSPGDASRLLGTRWNVRVSGIGRIHTIPDYVGNWAAATGGEPGVIVIGGGGSVAYGRTGSGEAACIGGWGHLLGDEGSGFWIGLQAIKAVLKSRAGVTPKTALEERVMQRFGTDDDRQVIREVYSATFSEAEVAGLVPLVASHAQDGDETAAGILDEAAGHLAGIALAVLRRLGDLPVYPSGGVFRAPVMRERFEWALARSEVSVEVKDAISDNPLRGVFLIARQGLEQ